MPKKRYIVIGLLVVLLVVWWMMRKAAAAKKPVGGTAYGPISGGVMGNKLPTRDVAPVGPIGFFGGSISSGRTTPPDSYSQAKDTLSTKYQEECVKVGMSKGLTRDQAIMACKYNPVTKVWEYQADIAKGFLDSVVGTFTEVGKAIWPF